jgi:hypothetical protein
MLLKFYQITNCRPQTNAVPRENNKKAVVT